MEETRHYGEETDPVLDKPKKIDFKKIKKIALLTSVTWSSVTAIIATIFGIIFCLIGSFFFDHYFGVGPSYSTCEVNNRPSNYRYDIVCDSIVKRSYDRWFVPTSQVEKVVFDSRDVNWNGKISANLLLQKFETENKPFVIVTHGLRGCNSDANALLPATQLFANGFNVLMIDLRNHGKSNSTSFTYATFGSEEYMDILSSLDYLQQRFPPLKLRDTAKIGLVGIGMGGSASLIALNKDTRLRAAFVDSPICLVSDFVKQWLDRDGLYGNMALGAACTVANMKSPYGCPPFRRDVLDAITKISSEKAVYFVHATNDNIVPIENSLQCLKSLNQSDVSFVDYYFNSTIPKDDTPRCTGHAQLAFVDPYIYQKKLVDFFKHFI